uniref:Uncharacterized protein n=1 Tax=Hyaloperonospora arabidopsidis (strain Emoy2) TaxID=559515 RepID=M4BYT8_HYAAE
MTVNDLLIIPEIQEVLKRDVSDDKPMLAALSMYSYTGSPRASIYDKVANTEPEGTEEKLRFDKHDKNGYRQVHSPVSNAVGSSTGSDVTKEQKPRTSDNKLVQFYQPADKTVQGICATELRDLRRAAQVRMASLQRIKLEKEIACRQQHQIQELQSELLQLLQIEAQLVAYEQRSEDSIEAELEMCKEEIASLSGQMQEAAQKELDWVAKVDDVCHG